MWIRIDHIDDLNRKNIVISNLTTCCFAVLSAVLLFSPKQQNSKHVPTLILVHNTNEMSRYYDVCGIRTYWHALAHVQPVLGTVPFCCFVVLPKQQPMGQNSRPITHPKHANTRFDPRFINRMMGSDWVFKGSSQLPIGTKWQLLRPSRETLVSRENPGGEWAQPLRGGS